MAIRRTVRTHLGGIFYQDKEPVTCPGLGVVIQGVGGVGTELKLLLSLIGITDRPGCRCKERAAEMDRRGIFWCEQNIETISGWLKEEATLRRLPFVKRAAISIIRKAIKNAKAHQT